MKQKYFLALAILGIILVSGCVQKGNVVTAPLVLEPNITCGPTTTCLSLNSQSSGENLYASKSIFLGNYDAVIDGSKKVIISEGFMPSMLKCIEERTALEQYISIEKRKWNDDYAWVGNKELFVIELPVVSSDDISKELAKLGPNIPPSNEEINWTYEDGRVLVSQITCKNTTEQAVIENETGKPSCSSGTTETWKESGFLTFLMDEEGVIYFAGGYCQ